MKVSKSICDILKDRSLYQSNKLAFTFLDNLGQSEFPLNYRTLHARACAVATELSKQAKPGDRIALLMPSSLEYIVSFFGCLYAGMVAVPLYPPRRRDKHSRVGAVLRSCQAKLAIVGGENGAEMQSLLCDEEALFTQTHILSAEEITQVTPETKTSDFPCHHELAFLQYTSGSTGTPKGVMITHNNIISNVLALQAGTSGTDSDVFVNWLPLFHDLGLVNTMLFPVFLGAHSVIMPSDQFVKKPYAWLKAIEAYRGSICGGPNFAFDLCCEALSSKEVDDLDLSSWAIVYNAAEPIRAQTLSRFSAHFENAKLNPNAIYPCYGMAEATVFVTSVDRSSGPVVRYFDQEALKSGKLLELDADNCERKKIALISCGYERNDHKLRIVDPHTSESLDEGNIGEIWFQGSSVSEGYWGLEDATQETFGGQVQNEPECGHWLRTGDTGFIINKQLYIAGRIKDTIIIRGMNFYPQDIELCVKNTLSEDVHTGYGAAFSIDIKGQESLVIVQEVRIRDGFYENVEIYTEKLRRAIAQEFGIEVYELCFVRMGKVPRTSSGKVQRRGAKQCYLDRTLLIAHQSKLNSSCTAEKLTKSELIGLSDQALSQLISVTTNEQLSQLTGESIERLQACADWTSWGGSSLVLMRFGQIIEFIFSINLRFSEMAACGDLSALQSLIKTKIKSTAVTLGSDVELREGNELSAVQHTLSYQQRAIWAYQEQFPDSKAYHVPLCLEVKASYNEKALNLAFRSIIHKHTSLRIQLNPNQGLPPSVTLFEPELFQLEFIHCHTYGEIDAQIAQIICQPFQIYHAPLLRSVIIKCSAEPSTFRFVLVCHHILVDYHSIKLLQQDFLQAYEAALSGDLALPHPAPNSYAKFIEWQNNYVKGDRYSADFSYWQKELRGNLPVLVLSNPIENHHESEFSAEQISEVLSQEQVTRLKTIGKHYKATLAALVLTCYKIALARCSDQSKSIVGISALGRPNSEHVNDVGYFVNPIAILTHLPLNTTLADAIQQVSTKLQLGVDHQWVPFEHLVSSLGRARSPEATPVFQTMMVFHQDETSVCGESGQLVCYQTEAVTAAYVPVFVGDAQFDLTLEVTESVKGLNFNLVRNVNKVNSCLAQSILRSLVYLCQHLPEIDVAIELAQIGQSLVHHSHLIQELETAASRDSNSFQNIQLSGESTWLHGFAKVASEFALAPAINFGLSLPSDSVSYQKLEANSNRLAHMLRDKGIGPGHSVLLFLNNKAQAIESMLGVMKSGACYIPLEVSWPMQRIAQVVQDAQSVTVITLCSLLPTLSAAFEQREKLNVITLDQDANAQCHILVDITDINQYPDERLEYLPCGDDLAYVLYTSGSTGKPKGVKITHASLMNYVSWAAQNYPGYNNWSLLHTQLSFDLTLSSIFPTLLKGGEILISDISSGEQTLDEFLASRVTPGVIKLTPSHLVAWQDWARNTTANFPIASLVVGGEALIGEILEVWFQAAPGVAIFNEYGPTETTVGSVVHKVRPGQKGAVAIGRPIQNTQTHILDSAGIPVLPGAIGELYISGLGVGQGYLNQPDTTASVFIKNENTLGERWYKTGDLVMRDDESHLWYLGRIDEQLNIKGFRIELTEVESALLSLDRISAVKVVGWNPLWSQKTAESQHNIGPSQLVGVLVAQDTTPVDLDWVQREMKNKLPHYMQPDFYLVIDALPLTRNGKMDQKAIYLNIQQTFGANLVEPRMVDKLSVQESILVDIWQALLGRKDIGVNDNFFALGGDSIKAIQCANRAQRMGIKQITMQHLMRWQTIGGVVAHLDEDKNAEDSGAIDLYQPLDSLALCLSPLQKEFVETCYQEGALFRQSVLLDFTKAPTATSVKTALLELLKCHHVLRTQYSQQSDSWHAQVRDVSELEDFFCFEQLEFPVDLKVEARHGYIQEVLAQNSSTVLDKKMFMAILFCQQSEPSQLLLSAHHMNIDWVSWQILLDELRVLLNRGSLSYQAENQFAQWSNWLHSHESLLEARSEEAYWQKTLMPKGLLEHQLIDERPKAVPNQYPVQQSLQSPYPIIELKCHPQLTQKLTKLIEVYPELKLEDLLLAGFAQALLSAAPDSASTQVVVNVESHGRFGRGKFDLSRACGWFTQIYPVRLNFAGAKTLVEMAYLVANTLKSVPRNGIGYGVLAHLTDENQLPPSSPYLFNYLGHVSAGQAPCGELSSVLNSSDIGFTLSQFVARQEKSKWRLQPHAITMNSMLHEGTLCLYCEYDNTRVKHQKVKQLIRDIEESLTNFVEVDVIHSTSANELSIGIVNLGEITLEHLNVVHSEQAQVFDFIRHVQLSTGQKATSVFPLTKSQQGLVFQTLHEDASENYVEQVVCDLHMELETRVWKHAWQDMLDCHSALRTGIFATRNLQVTFASCPIVWFEQDLSALAEDEYREFLAVHLEQERKIGFELENAPLTRFELIKHGKGYSFIWHFHHAVMDGWSMATLFKQVAKRYDEIVSGKREKLSRGLQYSKFVEWLECQNFSQAMGYWRTYLESADLSQSLPIKGKGQPMGELAGMATNKGRVETRLPQELVQELETNAQRLAVPSTVILQMVFELVLLSQVNTNHFVYGEAVSGRPEGLIDIESAVGLYVNSLPVVARINAKDNFRQWAKTSLIQRLERGTHDFVSLAEIKQNIPHKVNRAASTILFDVMLNIDNYPIDPVLRSSNLFDLDKVEYQGDNGMALTFVIVPCPSFKCYIDFDVELFNESDVNAFLQSFKQSLIVLCEAEPEALVGDTLAQLRQAHMMRNTGVLQEKRKPRRFVRNKSLANDMDITRED